MEYAMSLTARQVEALYERYWYRVKLDMEIQMALNPLVGKRESSGGETIDGTNVDNLASAGIVVKQR